MLWLSILHVLGTHLLGVANAAMYGLTPVVMETIKDDVRWLCGSNYNAFDSSHRPQHGGDSPLRDVPYEDKDHV